MFKTDLLWQNDDRWADLPLGSGPHTIKEWGCLMVDLCMIVNGYGYNETPQTFNNKMKTIGGFQGEMVNAWVLSKAYPGVQALGYDECENTPAPIAKIDAALSNGDPVVVQVDWSPNAGVQSHWVIAYARKGNDYLVYDPYKYSGDAPGKELGLLTRYNHQGDTLEEAISAVLFLSGQNVGGAGSSSGTGSLGASVPQPAPKVAVPAESFDVYATTDGLAFRSAASVGSTLIRRLNMSDRLQTLEKASDAKAKLGQYNQWLKIQDPTGDQGYIAAWYAATAPEPAAPKTGGQPGSSPSFDLTVTPTTEGLALRDQPSIQGNLLKRLPFTAKLLVLEPVLTARQKIGIFGKWLNIRDIAGVEGHVAAWYVTETMAPALGVKAPADDGEGGAPDPGSGLVVRTATDGLAFRSEPRVAAETLIKRLALQSELLLKDPEDKNRVGQVGQWIKVKELGGQEGWVAAWHVNI